MGLRAVSSFVFFVTKPLLEECIGALFAVCISSTEIVGFLFYFGVHVLTLCLDSTRVWYTSVIRGKLHFCYCSV